MKIFNIAVLIFASCIAAKNIYYLDNLVSALKSGNSKRDAKNVVSLDSLHAALEEEEKKLNEGLDAVDKKKRSQGVLKSEGPLLQTLLPQVPDISIFSGYLRDNSKLSAQMEDSGDFTIVLAPTDEAVQKFSIQKGLKPWEYPFEVKNDETDEEVIEKNINFFIDAHTSSSALEKDRSMVAELRNGHFVTISQDKAMGGKFILNTEDEKYVVSSAHDAGNGILLVVEHVLVR